VIGFRDAHDLKVGAVLVLLEEAADVAVDKAGDGDAEWG
jgi:hypothetical protein